MKKYLSLFLFAAWLAPVIAQAQIATTRAECFRRCSTLLPPPDGALAAHNAKMATLQAKKKDEKNPERIKEIEKEEAEEIELLEDAKEQRCSAICRHNPTSEAEARKAGP